MDPFWSSTIVILINLYLTRGTQLKLVKKSPKEIYVYEGNSYTLECEYDRKIQQCSWLRYGYPVKIRDRYKYVSGNGTDTVICSFTVQNAEMSFDNTQWHCSVSGNSDYNGVDSEKTTVKVLVKPEIQWNGTKVAKLYSPWKDTMNVNLKCVSRNNMTPSRLCWTINGIENGSLTNGKELNWDEKITVRSLMQIDCTAESSTILQSISQTLSISHHTERNLTITVNGQLKTENSTIEVEERNTLNCKADGEPQPIYRWIFRYIDEKNDSWTFYPEDFHENQQQIVPNRVGDYRCIAFDRLNETNVTSDLVVTVLSLTGDHHSAVDVAIIVGGSVVIFLIAFILIYFSTVLKVRITRLNQVRQRSTDNNNPNGGEVDNNSLGQLQEADSLRQMQETLIPPPPTIPLPLLPPRSTSLLFRTYGAASVPSSPQRKRLPPKPPSYLLGTKGHGGSCNTLGSLASSNSTLHATMRFGFQKAPQPLPRQMLNMETTRQKTQQEDGSKDGYIMPDRPDLWPSHSNNGCLKTRQISHVGMDSSVYSTIVAFENGD